MKYSTIADDYSNVNAFALAIVGLMSSIIFGYVVDWANHYTYFAKTFIIVLGSLTAPFCMHVLTATDNFNIAGLMWILQIFFKAAFWGPCITMIQDTTPQRLHANAISLFYVTITLSQVSSPIILSAIGKLISEDADAKLYGDLLSYTTVIAYVSLLPFALIAGSAYKEHMERQDAADELN